MEADARPYFNLKFDEPAPMVVRERIRNCIEIKSGRIKYSVSFDKLHTGWLIDIDGMNAVEVLRENVIAPSGSATCGELGWLIGGA